MEVNGQLHALAALPLKKNFIFPLDGRLGWPQGSSGSSGEEESVCPRRETNPDFSVVHPVAKSCVDGAIPSCNICKNQSDNVEYYKSSNIKLRTDIYIPPKYEYTSS
jgi:hypothetical protein